MKIYTHTHAISKIILHAGLLIMILSGAPEKAQANKYTQKKSVHFLENLGQMTDMNGKPVPYVFFKAEAPNVNLWLTEKGITLQTLKTEEKEEKMGDVEKESSELTKEKDIHWERVDITLRGASIKKENIVKENSSSEHFNFFNPNCPNGIYGVKEYEKITIKDVYPGIDWLFYNSGKKGFKYDFIVHPGADPNQIKLVYSSKEKLNIAENGELQVNTAYGSLAEEAPETFLYNKTIESHFKKISEEPNNKGGYDITIGFDFPNYIPQANTNSSLRIDPQLFWSTFFGGSASDGPVAIKTDHSGNVFVTGYTESYDFPTQDTGTFFQGTIGASISAFIMKFSNAGALIWSTYYGSNVVNEQTWGSSITVDASDNIFITGRTNSTTFPTQNAGTFFQGAYGGGTYDAIILKFDNAGNRLWATYYGGSGVDEGDDITTDAAGNVFVTGYTASANFATQNTGTFYQGAITGSNDAFILKFDDSGNRLWATFYGNNAAGANAYGRAITTDASGNIFITGSTVGHTGFFNFPVQNAGTFFQGTNAGSGTSEAFILKFDNAGNRLWATLYGGSLDDYGFSIITDAAGNIFVAGETKSTDFPTKNSGTFFQATNAGGADAFILKFDNAGNRLWATYDGGSGDDYGFDYFFSTHNLAVDKCGNVYFSFETSSTNMTTLAGCDGGYIDSTFNGGTIDQFISLFTNTGTILWATYLGGSGADHRSAISLDQNGNLFITGEWSDVIGGTTVISSTYPFANPGAGAYNDTLYNGADDGFIAKFCSHSCICNSFAGCTQAVLPYPIFVSSDTVFCNESGKCIDFTDQSINNPTSWKWYFPGATPDTSTQQNPTNICYYNPGTYSVKLVVSNSNGSDSVTVNPMITFATGAVPPVLTYSGDTIYCSHAAAYQWYLNGSPIANATDSFYVTTGDGVYAVQITDNNGCTRLSNGFPVAVNELNASGGMKIYPNPAGDQFTINDLQFTAGTTIKVYNMLGENVYSGLLNKMEETINCKYFSSGIYIVEVGTLDKVFRAKFVKE